MIRSDQANKDTHFVILAYRVTLRGSDKLILVKAMTQHKFRALLPIRQHLPVRLEESREFMLQQMQKQAGILQPGRTTIAKLQQGQKVCVQLDPWQPAWQWAKVMKMPTSRSPRADQVQTLTQVLVLWETKGLYDHWWNPQVQGHWHYPAPVLPAMTLAAKSVLLPCATPVHMATPKMMSPRPWWRVWSHQRLVEEMP